MIILELFLAFFKIGLFTFGGGYAMLPLVREEVLSHGWMADEEIVNFIAVSESTPGSFSINIATFVGMKTGGLAGAAAATVGVALPAFLVIFLAAKFFEKIRASKTLSAGMTGLKAAVIGLIGAAFLELAATVFFREGTSLRAFTGAAFWVSLVIFAAAAVLSFREVHPVLLICIAAVVGIAAGYLFGVPV